MNNTATTSDRAAEFTVFLGLLFFFSGLFCIVAPHVYAPFFDHYVGWLFLLIGTIQFFHAYSSQQGWALVLLMTLATLNVLMGGLILNNPYTDILGLVMPIAALLMAEGAAKVMVSFAFTSRPGWTWYLISGLMTVLMGSLVYAGLPTTSFWVLGLLFGINHLVTGFAAFYATLMQQRQDRIVDEVAEEEPEEIFERERVEETADEEESETAWPESTAAA